MAWGEDSPPCTAVNAAQKRNRAVSLSQVNFRLIFSRWFYPISSVQYQHYIVHAKVSVFTPGIRPQKSIFLLSVVGHSLVQSASVAVAFSSSSSEFSCLLRICGAPGAAAEAEFWQLTIFLPKKARLKMCVPLLCLFPLFSKI